MQLRLILEIILSRSSMASLESSPEKQHIDRTYIDNKVLL